MLKKQTGFVLLLKQNKSDLVILHRNQSKSYMPDICHIGLFGVCLPGLVMLITKTNAQKAERICFITKTKQIGFSIPSSKLKQIKSI